MPTVVAFIPHPDDESYAFGATLAAAAAAGWRCHVECASAGERGKRHDGGPDGISALARTRREELARSCAILGTDDPVCWDLPDGGLRSIPPQVPRVRAVLDNLRPEVVLSLGPDGAYGHPDHVAMFRWVAAGWRSSPAGPALLCAAFPRGLFAPQWERCRGMLGDPPDPPVERLGGGPVHYTLSAAAMEPAKRRAIAAHRSQLPGGEAEALFPPGLVRELLPAEHFEDATGRAQPAVAAWFAEWQQAALVGPTEANTVRRGPPDRRLTGETQDANGG